MNAVTVFVKHQQVTLTLAEAEKLLEELQRGIRHARNTTDELLPPELTADGYLTRKALDRFFDQVDGVDRSIHVGKLFARITSVACTGGTGINVVCRDCGRLIHEMRRCPASNNSHLVATDLMIEASSLKANAEKFISAGYRNVGPVMANNLRLLCDHL